MSKEIRKVNPETDRVNCNLCGKLMTLSNYDRHYDKCLDIQYLMSIAKKQGKDLPREDLESAKPEVIRKLMEKYEPKGEMGTLTQRLKEG